MSDIISTETIESRIYLIRGIRAMLDRDLAELYSVSTSDLNKAVTRNIDRFPSDFMFQLSPEEFSNLKFHFGTSSWGGTRKLPRAYTEQGVAMLSSILRSNCAVQVNIQIMRTFIKMRRMITVNEEIKQELGQLRKQTDERFQIVFEVLDQLPNPESTPKKEIGFTVKEKVARYG
jgi:hypothetical protein